MPLRRLAVVVPLLIATAASAAVDPASFQDLHWRLIGPFRGGRVLAVAGVPSEPKHFYFGSVNGGVWESNDAGRTWQPIFDSQPVGSIGAIAVAPSDPSVLYVGTGEADMRSDIAQGDGMYKSTDAGKTWTHIGLADSQQIGKILVDPHDAKIVYVAALGHPYGANAERGVFKSTDGGATWTKSLAKDDATGAVDLAFAPDDSSTLYASLWQTRRPPWNIYPPSYGPGSGLYKSTDAGRTWKEIRGRGFPSAKLGRIGVAVAPGDPKRVYAMVDAQEGGLYRSDDGGETWARGSADQRIWQRGWYFSGVTVDPKNADVVYACNTNLYRSTDGGKTFVPFKGAPGGDDYHTLWIDPAEPARQILGVDQGAVVTLNGGRTWSSWFNQPTAQIYRLSTDTRFPYWVYGAQQDSGAAALPSRTTSNDGINMTHFREPVAGGESNMIAPDPLDPEIVYGGTVDKLDLRTQQTRSVDPTLAYPDIYRRTWTLPLTFSHRDPHVLYFAHQRLFRTADGGEHWTPISPDLTRENPGVPRNLDASSGANDLRQGPRRGVIFTIAPSYQADRDIWVGTDDGKIWRTRDEGTHWSDVTPASLGAWSKVGTLEPSRFDADTAYAAIDRHRLDDFAPHILRTRDGGKSWTEIVSGIAATHAVNVVREDPQRKGLLFAGTERGVYVSFDDGAHWQSLQRDLPTTSVRDIAIHGDDLVIATHGRGFFVIDDIAPLRELDDGAAPTTRLFRPAIAHRLRTEAFAGTPFPKDEPMAANPPSGAYIDYSLARAASAPVTLEIFDSEKTLVRRYASDAAPPPPDLAKLTTAPEWVRAPSTLSAAAGMHRFVWTQHYPAPAPLADGDAYADGVWAPPGAYIVVLTVDGQRFEQPLAIEPDPRVKLDAGAYAAQFDLAQRVETERARLAVATARAAKAIELATARRAAATGELATALDAFVERAHAIAGTASMPNRNNAWSFPPKRVETLRWTSEALDQLFQAVDGADAAPSPDARDCYAKLADIVGATVGAWQAFERDELAALNAKLLAARSTAIELDP